MTSFFTHALAVLLGALKPSRDTWLEQDGVASDAMRGRWIDRARQWRSMRDAQRRADDVDLVFAEHVRITIAWNRDLRASGRHDPRADRLTALWQQSRDDAKDRPWLKTRVLYPTCATNPHDAAVALVASLSCDPPRVLREDEP